MTGPFVAIGITAVGIITLAAILGISADYMDSALTAQDAISTQNTRGSEDLILTIENKTLYIANNGINPVRIKEVRVLDADTKSQISNIDYSQIHPDDQALRIDSFEVATVQHIDLEISEFDKKKILAITDLGNVFVAKQVHEDDNNKSSTGQGSGMGMLGNGGTFRTLDLAGQVIHGQGVVGKGDSLRSYTDVSPTSNFAAVVLDDERVISMPITEFVAKYQYSNGQLNLVDEEKPNMLGFSQSRTLGGNPSASITNDGIVISGTGKMLLKISDIPSQTLKLSGIVSSGNSAKILETETNLITAMYDTVLGFLLYYCQCNPSPSGLDVLVSNDDSDVSGKFQYKQSYHVNYYHGKCCKGMNSKTWSGIQTVVSDLVFAADSNDGFRVKGDNTNPVAATITLPSGGKLNRVNHNTVSDFNFWLHDKNGGPITSSWTSNFAVPVLFDSSRDTYLLLEKNTDTLSIKGENYVPDADTYLEITGLPANIPFEISKQGIVGIRGITSDTGKISLLAEQFDFGTVSTQGGILKIYPDSMLYRGSFSTVVFDTINRQTIHFDDGHDRVYTAFAYVRLPFAVDATINNVSIGDVAIPYLNGDYQSGETIYLPIIPNTEKITMDVNGINTTIRLQDLPDVTGGKPIPPETATNSDFNSDGSLASIATDAGSAAFAVATDEGQMYAMVTMSVSGNSAFSQDVSLHFTPNPPPPPIPRDPLSVYVDVYKNGDLAKSEMVYYDDKPIFTPLNKLNGMSLVQATDYYYNQRTISAMTLIDVEPGDFVEFFVRTHIYAEGIPIPYSLVPESGGGTYSIDKVVSAATATAKIHHGSILTGMA